VDREYLACNMHVGDRRMRYKTNLFVKKDVNHRVGLELAGT
jgi:hypothetical protein